MASLLRSGKFVRYFSNLTRNFAFNNGSRTENETILCMRKNDWEIKLHRTITSVNQLPPNSKLDGSVVSGTVVGSRVDQALYVANGEIKKQGRLAMKDVVSIINAVKEAKSATASQALLLIRCCGNLLPEELPTVRDQLVERVWNLLNNFGVPIDISHYNALLRVYLENEHSFNPIELLEKIQAKNIEPNRVTYQRMLAAYCLKGDLDGASKILEIMKSKSLPINELVFNSLVTGHCRLGDLESAKGVIAVMTKSGLEPNNETYTALMSGYASLGQTEEVISTIDECVKREVPLYDRDLLEVFQSAAVNNQHSLEDILITRMPRKTGYNQECVNAILRLVNQGREDAAFKVYNTMKPATLDGQPPSSGNFLIRQLVKAKVQSDKVITFANQLMESGSNPRALFRTLEAANNFGHKDLIQVVLKEIVKKKELLPSRAFWPLLNSQSQTHGEKGVLSVLRQMSSLNVYPNIETVRDHVLPHVVDDKIERVIHKLRSANVPETSVKVSLYTQLLERNDFKGALELASLYKVNFDNNELCRSAAKAYLETNDGESLAKLVRLLIKDGSSDGTADVNVDVMLQSAQLNGPIVAEILRSSKTKANSIVPYLQALCDHGLTVSSSTVQLVREKFGENIPEYVADLLTKLSSGDLIPVDVKRIASKGLNEKDRNEYMQRANISQLLKANKLDEALKYIKQIGNKVPELPVGTQILLMDAYVREGKVEKALETYNDLVSKNPDIEINANILLRLATGCYKDGRVEITADLLKKLKPKENVSQFAIATEFSHLLAASTSKCDAEFTDRILETLKETKIVPINGFILAPIVRAHTEKKDIEGAIKAFENFVDNYKCTPFKNDLCIMLIESEDANNLQRVMDLSIKIHGEVNCLYDLVFSFLECGRLRQAKKVLETPGLRARHDKLENACQRYVQDQRVAELENLVKITRDLFDSNRSIMYQHLLNAYIKTDNPDGALNSWTMMQEEDIQPNDAFLVKLATFLKEKNREVPFSVPEIQPNSQPVTEVKAKPTTIPPADVVKKTEPSIADPNVSKLIRDAVESNNLDLALEINAKYKSKRRVAEKTILIDSLLSANRQSDAQKLVFEMLENQLYPSPEVFRKFFYDVTKSGNQEILATMDKLITPRLRRALAYDNLICSYVAEDPSKASDYMNSLLSSAKTCAGITDQDDKAVQDVKLRFPRSALIDLLEKNPDLVGICQELAVEFKKLGSEGPSVSLSCYYLLSGKKEEAAAGFASFETPSSLDLCNRHITYQIKRRSDLELAASYFQMISSLPSTTNVQLANTYAAWIHVLCEKQSAKEAVAVLEEATKKGISHQDIGFPSLSKLKAVLENLGETVPFTVPENKEKTSTKLEPTV